MSEETQPTDSGEVVTSEPSLDDIISEYNVPAPQAAEPSQFAPQEQISTPQTVDLPSRVDPLDENSFGQFTEKVASGQSVLSNQLTEVKSELTKLRQERAELQVEAEINQAVEHISKGTEVDPKFARVYLEYTAQEKPGFKSIWDNRHTNPQAYNKALEAVSREMQSKTANRQDPELTKTQQAISQSQRSMAAKTTPDTSGNPIQDKLSETKTDADFQREWQRIVSG